MHVPSAQALPRTVERQPAGGQKQGRARRPLRRRSRRRSRASACRKQTCAGEPDPWILSCAGRAANLCFLTIAQTRQAATM